MKLARRWLSIGVLAAISFAGCDEASRIIGIGGHDRSAAPERNVVGEVEYIDGRTRELEVRTESGRTALLRYDDRTQVVYHQRNYSAANLERGDYIAARIQQERDGRSYTDMITVRESVQDRAGGQREGSGGRLERIDGRIESIDPRRGTFELRDSRDRLIVVMIPFNAPRVVIDTFNRLRQGDSLEIEGRRVGARFELENFL
jgi:hypothetical protein